MADDPSPEAMSAVNRFGLGARPGERVPGDPVDWLASQLRSGPDGGAAFLGLSSSIDYMKREGEIARLARRRRGRSSSDNTDAGAASSGNPADLYRRSFGADLQREYLARWTVAANSATPFAERLVRFWSNHFSVSTDKFSARVYALPMEREAIRPHINGRYVDLLLAVEMHPAMLRYLDQVQSIGPNSRMAQRMPVRAEGAAARTRGLNENLAREILELHTLGADAGYSQNDVTELARALTGWSMPRLVADALDGGDVPARTFLYREAAHEPGARKILGRRYADDGQAQAEAILRDLAMHPATARHLATRMARHFVADTPPPALVQRIARAYLDSDGNLAPMYRTLIQAPQAWEPQARKFRTPQDFVIAAIRGASVAIGETPRPWEGALMRLGQPSLQPRSPAGFSDLADEWITPDAIYKRMQIAQALGERSPRQGPDAMARAYAVLGPRLDAQTRQALARAESQGQAIAILIASPAFQWRA